MPIIGIDYDKCINCGLCLRECGRRFIKDEQSGKIIYHDPAGTCFSCGHCIALCPENAIIHKDFGDEVYSFEGIENLKSYVPYERASNFLRANRSVRHYKKEKVPDHVLRKVFDVMQYSPTGANLRAEKYTLLSDEGKIKKLSDAVMEELLNNPFTNSVYKDSFENFKKIYHSPIYLDAPHVVFVSSPGDTYIEHIHVGINVTYGRLGAQSLGLVTCWNGWTMLAFKYNRKLMKLAGVHGKSWGVFTIGYPSVNFLRCPPRSKKRVKGLDY